MLYNGKRCVPRYFVSTILCITHDVRLGGIFKFLKTISRLANFHLRHKARDVNNYVRGCVTIQQLKDSNQKKLLDPSSLDMRERRWESLAADFIVQLQKTRDSSDATNTCVDRVKIRVHLFKCKRIDTAVDVAHPFPLTSLSYIACSVPKL